MDSNPILRSATRAAGIVVLAGALACGPANTDTAGAGQAKPSQQETFKTLTFPSEDGLEVTADLYAPHPPTAPFILLFHQAGWSRGEYREIAPKLNAMGFNCAAVDLRSGGEVKGVTNETHERAEEEGKSTSYLGAYQDMLAALDYFKKNDAKGKLILWGSSYSASLVIRLAAGEPSKIDGVVAFSPGEYFMKEGKAPDYITQAATRVTCPVFITSAKDEAISWSRMFRAMPSETKVSFVPETAGHHGSRSLWAEFPDHQAYWNAVSRFLDRYIKK